MDPTVSPEFQVPLPVTLPANGLISDLFVGHTAHIKETSQGIPPAILKVFMPSI